MSGEGAHTRADAACRAAYRRMDRECRRRGLDAAAVARWAPLAERRDGRWYLAPAAYRPTGVALGCPLPDPAAARRLWRLALLAGRVLGERLPPGTPALALVPPAAYHVTLANRSHYERTEGITPLSAEEREAARRALAKGAGEPVALVLHGLVLSRAGRLFVPGFPCGDRLYELRARLRGCFPPIPAEPPGLAHVKLGHLLAPLGPAELERFLGWTARAAPHAAARLLFREAHTPAGVLPL